MSRCAQNRSDGFTVNNKWEFMLLLILVLFRHTFPVMEFGAVRLSQASALR